MPLPDITHLQFAVLSALGASEMSGRALRAELAKHGVKKSAPAFYQLMARLEEQKLVKGWYVPIEVDGHRIRERRYKLLAAGARAVAEARAFYESQARLSLADATGGVC
ncbi:MAG: hypothetical protein FJX75_00005 [Armatimonadetes bacterium]|nr:hypothetical protein [Armatimonadota bacterium]